MWRIDHKHHVKEIHIAFHILLSADGKVLLAIEVSADIRKHLPV